MDCQHSNSRSANGTREIAGLRFNYVTRCCSDCGGMLWSQDTEKEFQSWLGNQRLRFPDHFVIHNIALSPTITEIAFEIAAKNQTSPEAVYRACLALYFIRRQLSQEIVDPFDATEPLRFEPLINISVPVSPKVFLKIDSNARTYTLTMSDVASWSIHRVLWAAKDGNKQILAALDYALAV